MNDSALALSTIAPKLRKLLPLLGSDKPGEIVATANAIGRTLRSAGLDLHDLTRALTRTGSVDSFESAEPVTWRDIPATERPAWLTRMADSPRLSPWETDFCASILGQVRFQPWQRLTDKQVAVLDRCICKFASEVRQ